MKKLCLVLVLCLAGCLTPDTKEELAQRRNDLAAAQIRLKAVTETNSPDFEAKQADVQLAEVRLEEVQAKAIQERIASGGKFVEIGASLLPGPWAVLSPLVASALTAAVAAVTMLLKKGGTSVPGKPA
jgi:outer membrane murein-binding lipoprotein Lpp